METSANETSIKVTDQDSKGIVKSGEEIFNKNGALCHKMDASHGTIVHLQYSSK